MDEPSRAETTQTAGAAEADVKDLSLVVAARFPIVGVGASAGGLAAFEAFFSGMPTTESAMAFVLVQHLAPDHKSLLVELVKRYTRMAVFEVEDGMRVQPNCAYIIPPNRDMALLNGALQLFEPVAARGQRLSIDFFFRSLAQDQGQRAICIILSGSGSDGTQGMRAIKAEGGMAMAQNPASTEYDAMPRSAIATGLVDYILPPAEMPRQLVAYVNRALPKNSQRGSPPAPKGDDALNKVFVLLRAHTGHDFSQYKRNTVVRRIERRMAVQAIAQLDDYLRYVQGNPGELEALFQDLLIGVTSFFRDPEAFAALDQQLTLLLSTKPTDAVIRAWTSGCSTGEEAYSLAILLREQMETLKRTFKIQLFATDIDSRAIDTARVGMYPASIAQDVSPERLARFFSAEDGSYRIQKSIRDQLIFSEQDLIKDPPFSKLDLICCRNLLIYLGPELQRKVLRLFHYALNPSGLLFLGSSETIGDFADLFSPVDRKAKLYQRLDGEGSVTPLVGFLPRTNEAVSSAGAGQRAGTLPVRELTERTLLTLAPEAALVDEHGDLLYLHGNAGRYLEPAPGEAGLSILKMAREGLRQELADCLRRAQLEQRPASYPDLRVKIDGEDCALNLSVLPVFGGDRSPATLFLVAFERLAVPNEPLACWTTRASSGAAWSRRLRR